MTLLSFIIASTLFAAKEIIHCRQIDSRTPAQAMLRDTKVGKMVDVLYYRIILQTMALLGGFPYCKGIYQSVDDRGNLRRKLQNVWGLLGEIKSS